MIVFLRSEVFVMGVNVNYIGYTEDKIRKFAWVFGVDYVKRFLTF